MFRPRISTTMLSGARPSVITASFSGFISGISTGEIEKVTDVGVILRHGVMSTPALVVDGQVKVAGHVPTAERLKELLS